MDTMHRKWWILISLFIVCLSFLALYYIVNFLWPNPHTVFARPQLFLLVFIFLGLSSGTIPIAVFLNDRFAKSDWLERDKFRLFRQGLWVGVFGVLLVYLQLIRALGWTIVMVLAGIFILIEAFLLTRD